MAALSTQEYKFKKVLTGFQGEVDLPLGQVTFILTLPVGKGLGKVVCQLHQNLVTCKKSPGQAKFDSYLSEGQAGIQFFFNAL